VREAGARTSPIEGVDVARGLARALSDKTFYAELLGIFAESQKGAAAALEEAIAQGRRPEAIRIAHTAKGEAANIAAEEVRLLAGTCERILREGRDSELPAAIEDFKASMARVVRDIATFLEGRRA
jgi:HPt (histidine-containing phosphotransfer) domain-containing protein